MSDGLERELQALDGARSVPPALYDRLEAALLEDADARRTGDHDVAVALGALDVPRPVPASTRAALESALIRTDRRDIRSRVVLAAAAAIILVVGAVAVFGGGGSPSHHQVAVGPAPSASSPSVPAQEQAPATAGAAAPGPTATNAPRAQSSAAARATTPTTWDCGRCARNGYTGSATSPTSPPSTATFQPTNGTQAAAVLPASLEPGISSVDPASGPHQGGTVVILKGFGFTGANGVRFGAAAAVNFTVVSDGEIRVQTPPSPTPQRVTVTVTYPDGSSTATSDDGPFFSYT